MFSLLPTIRVIFVVTGKMWPDLVVLSPSQPVSRHAPAPVATLEPPRNWNQQINYTCIPGETFFAPCYFPRHVTRNGKLEMLSKP